jgi:hypothetical protein
MNRIKILYLSFLSFFIIQNIFCKVNNFTLSELTVKCFEQYKTYPKKYIGDHNIFLLIQYMSNLLTDTKTIINKETFTYILDEYKKRMKKQENGNFNNKENWTDEKKPQDVFFEHKEKIEMYESGRKLEFPYVQKMTISNNKRIEIFVAGDHHGNIHTLLRNLWRLVATGKLNNDFEITDKNFRIVFLGDYVNRGAYSSEVVYTLCRLKLAGNNWDKVILIRGNHETTGATNNWGFFGWGNNNKNELSIKYKDNAKDLSLKIARWFDFLPLSVFIGNKENGFMQFSHAGFGETSSNTNHYN